MLKPYFWIIILLIKDGHFNFNIRIKLFNRFTYSIKKVGGGGDHTPENILRVGGPENFVILWVGGPGNIPILRVVGMVRHPQVIAYGGNSAGGWSKENCNSAGGWFGNNCYSVGGWSEKSSVVTPPTDFFYGIALRAKMCNLNRKQRKIFSDFITGYGPEFWIRIEATLVHLWF